MDEDLGKNDYSVPESEVSLSPVKKIATTKSPSFVEPKIKLPFGGNKKKKNDRSDVNDANEED
jgi:hypothetical protein